MRLKSILSDMRAFGLGSHDPHVASHVPLRDRVIHEYLESRRGHLPHSRPGHQILLCASGTHTRSRARERGLRPHSTKRAHVPCTPPPPRARPPAHIDPTCDAQQDRVLTHTTIHTPNRCGSLSPPPPPACTRGAALPVRVFIATKGTHMVALSTHKQTRCRTDMQQHSSAVSFGRSYHQTTAARSLQPSCTSGAERLCSGAASALTRCA